MESTVEDSSTSVTELLSSSDRGLIPSAHSDFFLGLDLDIQAAINKHYAFDISILSSIASIVKTNIILTADNRSKNNSPLNHDTQLGTPFLLTLDL